MADENQTNEVEELAATAEAAAEELVSKVTDEVAEVAEDVAETAEDVVVEAEADAEAAEDAVVEAEAEVDQKVEDAVRHVAEEAAADEAAAIEALDTIAPEQASEEAPKKRERRSKQARAEKAARAGVDADEPVRAAKAAGASKAAGLSTPVWIAISVAALALGLVLGRFVMGGGSVAAADLNGKTTVAESELDNAYATFTYDGTTDSITIREVIEQNGTLDAALTDDGTYKLPSAEYALNVARTKILNKEIESRNIEVTDEEVTAYAEQALGTSDYDAIASTYGMDAETVKQLITDNCRLSALRDEIVGELPEMPAAPTEAEEGKEDELTKEYADYIIELAGDEWDAKAGAWADEEGSYATALADTEFSADGASYNMAQTAYYVAYQKYSEKSTEASTAWSEFLNGLLSKATIDVNSLVS